MPLFFDLGLLSGALILSEESVYTAIYSSVCRYIEPSMTFHHVHVAIKQWKGSKLVSVNIINSTTVYRCRFSTRVQTVRAMENSRKIHRAIFCVLQQSFSSQTDIHSQKKRYKLSLGRHPIKRFYVPFRYIHFVLICTFEILICTL